MSEVLMHKGIGLWLARKTKLTNRQIADFCKMHELEVYAFRNGNTGNVIAVNPVDAYILSEDMILMCEADAMNKLQSMKPPTALHQRKKTRTSAKKHGIVNAIFWCITQHPSLSNDAIAKLLCSTENLAKSIRAKEYKDYDTLISQHPVTLGLCTQRDLDIALSKISSE
jgi:hypothetical protein